jgi:hypothetical protein
VKSSEKKRKAGAGGGEAPAAGARLTGATRRKLQARDELQELQEEYALLKKLKRGKLTQHEYDVATGLSSDSDAEADAKAGSAAGGKNVDGAGAPGAVLKASSIVQQRQKAKQQRKKRRTQRAQGSGNRQ